MGWKKLGNRFWPRRSQRNQTGSLQVHFLVIRILVLKKQAESAQKANNSQGGRPNPKIQNPGKQVEIKATRKSNRDERQMKHKKVTKDRGEHRQTKHKEGGDNCIQV